MIGKATWKRERQPRLKYGGRGRNVVTDERLSKRFDGI